jgi:sortase A
MIGKTFYQPVMQEARYLVDSLTNKTYVVADTITDGIPSASPSPAPIIPKGGLASLLSMNKVEIMRPEDPNFSVVIPKIDANSKIIPNVNAANEEEYLTSLKNGVAHAQGTAFPGEGGHVFLFAHSTDYFWNVSSYNAVFFLLYKLGKGDEINLFYKNQRYVYTVVDTKIVEPNQIEYLTRKSNKEFLTLQTCWPPGTALKRLLVFAVRVVE